MASIRSRSGLLFMDFYCKNIRCREQTKLQDNPANRKRLQSILDRLLADILVNGDTTFSYSDYFPKSKMVKRFWQLNSLRL